MNTTKFVVDAGWQVLLKDMKINGTEVLKRAQLPGDLFTRRDLTLSIPEYFRLWNSLYETADDPFFPLRLGQAIPVESFHPALFAALCSPNLNIAMTRISQFKRLVGPLVYNVDKKENSTSVSVDCLDIEHPLPESIIVFELVFIVQFVRLAIREHIIPLAVSSSVPNMSAAEYTEYFGVEPVYGKDNYITFSTFDACRPFITENVQMWNFFEPELRRRLSELESEVDFVTRVRSSLLELLPAGQTSIDDVAKKLMVSKRTLQRRLSEESTSFQAELNKTREKLARYYLANSKLSGAEISFLLGFDDPNSFFRAFHFWTNHTPKQFRKNHNALMPLK